MCAHSSRLRRRGLKILPALFAGILCSASFAGPAANLALNRPAFSSVNAASAANVDDGLLATSWDDSGSASAPQDFVGVDLGAPVSLNNIVIYWTSNPGGFEIDGATSVEPGMPGEGNWTPLYVLPSGYNLGNPAVIPLSTTQQAQYIRIQGLGATGSTWGVQELQAYGTRYGATIQGSVTDALTSQPIRALISITSQTGGLSYSTSPDPNGNYSQIVQPDTYAITASAVGYNSQAYTVTVPPQGTQIVNFALSPSGSGGVIQGQVTDAVTGKPITTAFIAMGNGVTVYSTSTDSTGHYSQPVVPGTYAMSVVATGYVSQTMTPISVSSGGIITVNVPMPPYQTPASSIKGLVSDSVTGQPIAGVFIGAYSQSNPNTFSTSSGADGHYTLPVYPDTYTVDFSATNYDFLSVANQAVGAAAVLTLNVNLKPNAVPNGTIQGTVTDALTGALIQNATVTATPTAGAPVTATTGADGKYSMLVPAGTYSVQFAASGYDSQTVNGLVIAANATVTQDAALYPFPLFTDVVKAFRFASGMDIATPADMLRYDVVKTGTSVNRIDILDVLYLLYKAILNIGNSPSLNLMIRRPPVIDANETPVPNATKFTVGAQTWENLDNDDQDANYDTGNTDTDVAGENEMCKITIQLGPSALKAGTVKLEALAGGDTIMVWQRANKGTNVPLPVTFNVPADFTVSGGLLTKDLWVEGIAPHTSQQQTKLQATYSAGPISLTDKVSLTVLGIDSIAWVGRGNSVNNDNNLDDDPNFRNPDGSVVPPGSNRVFPDARTAGAPPALEANPRDQVDALVTLTVAPVEDIHLFFRSFDVDDPTSEQALPNGTDDEAADEDNRGAVGGAAAGQFIDTANANATVAILDKTFASGTKQDSIRFEVTMQPGDNFRIVGNGDRAFLNDLENRDSVLNVGATVNERNQNKQRIVNRFVTGAPADREIRKPDKYATRTLTVWRFLHVETDSMTAPPAVGNAQSSTIDRVIQTIAGAGGVAQTVTTTANIVGNQDVGNGAPGIADNSSRLDAGGGNGRYEHGFIVVGTTSTRTDNLDGNGANFVRRNAGITIPFTVARAGQANVSGNIAALAGTTFTVTPTAGALVAAHNGGTITVAGVDMNITGIGVAPANTVTVAAVNPVHVLIHDDDDDTVLPHDALTDFMSASDNRLQNLYADAYIRPTFDGGGNPANNTRTVPFFLNSESTNVYRWDSRANNQNRFWVVYILSSSQDSFRNMTTDRDPDAEGGTGGSTDAGIGGCLIYDETIRERIPTAGGLRALQPGDLERRIIVHEMGHHMRLDHGDNTDNLGNNGIMNTSLQNGPMNGDANWRFIPRHLDRLRRTNRPLS